MCLGGGGGGTVEVVKDNYILFSARDAVTSRRELPAEEVTR